MYGERIKIRKDPPGEKYTAEEFIKEFERYIKAAEDALEEDSLEMKRMDVLKNPIFGDYVASHFDPYLPPEKIAGFYHGMSYITEKYLAEARTFLQFLKDNPEIAKEIAENIEKPQKRGPEIIPLPLDPNLEPRNMKNH